LPRRGPSIVRKAAAASDPGGRSATPTRTAELSPSCSSSLEEEDARANATAAAAANTASSSADDSDSSATAAATRADKYNALMRERMGWRDPYQYHPELGLYHHEVAPGLIVGTQPRGRREVDRLVEETNATAILCLQEDKDAEHWGVDLGRVIRHAESRGLRHLRAPARDFDGDSLRGVLPRAVALLQREFESARSGQDGSSTARVYVHCTAGLGRAPAVAIAWRYWFGGGGEGSVSSPSSSASEDGGGGEADGGGDDTALWSLDAEYDAVTRVRPCGPRREAIAGATADLLARAGLGGGQGGEDLGATLTPLQRAAVQREAMRALLEG
jgi:hypothetical protein